MEAEVRVWLYDMLNAIEEIEEFVGNPTLDFSAFQKDTRTKRAIERNVGIIGEAMSRILVKNQNILLSNSRKIVDTRNRIIHGYDSVSDEIIWGIVKQHLSVLRSEILYILNSH